MGVTYQLDRAWANTSKGVRHCQKADADVYDGKFDAASREYEKALDYFSTAAEHLVKAEQDAEVKAGKLIDQGNEQLQKTVDEYLDGNADSAARHYEKALDKYDEALDLIV